MGFINRMSVTATLHCLTGCAIGEIVGMVIATLANLSNLLTIVVSIILAFIFGMSLTLRGLLKSGMGLRSALPVVVAIDALSITVMEIVDNGTELVIPGALNATLSQLLFWWSLALSLTLAFIAAVLVNDFLIRRGKGHALMHHGHSNT